MQNPTSISNIVKMVSVDLNLNILQHLQQFKNVQPNLFQSKIVQFKNLCAQENQRSGIKKPFLKCQKNKTFIFPSTVMARMLQTIFFFSMKIQQDY